MFPLEVLSFLLSFFLQLFSLFFALVFFEWQCPFPVAISLTSVLARRRRRCRCQCCQFKLFLVSPGGCPLTWFPCPTAFLYTFYAFLHAISIILLWNFLPRLSSASCPIKRKPILASLFFHFFIFFSVAIFELVKAERAFISGAQDCTLDWTHAN